MSRYDYADDYLMSGGKNAFESTVKGTTNRAIAEGFDINLLGKKYSNNDNTKYIENIKGE